MSKKRKAFLWLALAAMLLSASSVAEAQSGGSAGGASSATGHTEDEGTDTFECGAVIRSWVKTQNAPTNVTSTGSVTLPGASQQLLPSGGRCIKVLFTAESTCRGTTGIDQCAIAASFGFPGAATDPAPNDRRHFDSEAEQPQMHAYEWIRPVSGSSAVTMSILVRVGAAGTTFTLDDWTMEIELTA